MENKRNNLVLAISIIALSSIMLIWPEFYLFGKIQNLPSWAKLLPYSFYCPYYIAAICFMPIAFFSETLKIAYQSIAITTLISPLFAVIIYIINSYNIDHTYIIINSLFNYVWIIFWFLLIPAISLIAVSYVIHFKKKEY